MRKIWLAGLVMMFAGAGIVWADSLDDAEAKKRGVAVEVVQLEHAKEKIAELEKKIDSLQKDLAAQKKAVSDATTIAAAAKSELATLKASLTPEQQKQAATTQKSEEDIQFNIKVAIERRWVANGMTLDQVKQSVGKNCSLKLISKNGDIEEYEVWDGSPDVKVVAGMSREEIYAQGEFIAFKIKVSKASGRIVSWMDHHPLNQ